MSIRNASRKLAMLSASAVMVGTVAGLSLGTASSFALANGSQVPQSAVPIGPASNGAFTSGQSIEVKVPANGDLVAGSKVNILECADPSGTVSNLPTNIGECDGNTIQGGTASVATERIRHVQRVRRVRAARRSQPPGVGDDAGVRPEQRVRPVHR